MKLSKCGLHVSNLTDELEPNKFCVNNQFKNTNKIRLMFELFNLIQSYIFLKSEFYHKYYILRLFVVLILHRNL